MMNSRLLNEAKLLEQRWAKTKLLNGIKDPAIRQTTAVMLENQRLMNEAATDTADIAQFKRISIPLVRRIYPQLIANKIVSVQPLLGPTGLVYYLRFRYSSAKGATQPTLSGFPTDDPYSLQQLASGDANLDIFYSHQFVQNETQTGAGGNVVQKYALQKTPILPGTLVGTVYQGTTAVQTFTVPSSGTTLSFTSIGSPSTTASN
jgi:hypothetical protein